jgi:hypothetical protein
MLTLALLLSYTMRDKDVTILALLLLRDVNDDIDDK